MPGASGSWLPGTVLGEGPARDSETDRSALHGGLMCIPQTVSPPGPAFCPPRSPLTRCPSPGPAILLHPGEDRVSSDNHHHPSCRASSWDAGQLMEGPLTAPFPSDRNPAKHCFLEPGMVGCVDQKGLPGPSSSFSKLFGACMTLSRV